MTGLLISIDKDTDPQREDQVKAKREGDNLPAKERSFRRNKPAVTLISDF